MTTKRRVRKPRDLWKREWGSHLKILDNFGVEFVELHFRLLTLPDLKKMHTWLGRAIKYLEAREK